MAESQQLFRDCTRATQYQAKHTLPQSFSAIIKEYTREVLREQPADLLQWSAEYFKKKAIDNDPSCAQEAAAATTNTGNAADQQQQQQQSKSPNPVFGAGAADSAEYDEVAQKMTGFFSAMDESGAGRLYVHLLQRALLDHFGLSKDQALYILSSEQTAARDEDGMINFSDFARSAANAVVYFQQSDHKFVVGDASSVHGLEQNELRDELLRVFRVADSSEGLGRLSFAKFREALVSAPLQLTQRDINVLCAECERTSDGFVDVRHESNSAFPLLLLSRAFTEFDQLYE